MATNGHAPRWLFNKDTLAGSAALLQMWRSLRPAAEEAKQQQSSAEVSWQRLVNDFLGQERSARTSNQQNWFESFTLLLETFRAELDTDYNTTGADTGRSAAPPLRKLTHSAAGTHHAGSKVVSAIGLGGLAFAAGVFLAQDAARRRRLQASTDPFRLPDR